MSCHPPTRTTVARDCSRRSIPRFRHAISRLTRRALEKCVLRVLGLEYGFQRFVVHAAGAYVMRRLGAAGRFFYAQGERAGMLFDKLVAFTLSRTAFQLSNLVFQISNSGFERAFAIGCCRYLLIHGEAVGTSYGELCLQLVSRSNYLRFILKLHSRLVGVRGESDTGQKAGQVHEGHPKVETVGVGTSDSMAGDAPRQFCGRGER